MTDGWEVRLDVAVQDGHRLDLALHGSWTEDVVNVLSSEVDGTIEIRGGEDPARPVTGRIEVELRPAPVRGLVGMRHVRLDVEFGAHRLTVDHALGLIPVMPWLSLRGRLADEQRTRQVTVSIDPLQLLAQVVRLNLPQ